MIFVQGIPFRLPGGVKWFFLGWIAAEIAAFALVVHVAGLGGAILLGLLTTAIGIAMLRRVGSEAALSLRRAATGREPPGGALLDGMLTALGAVLLIVPGFVANFAGFALAAPSVRAWTMRKFGSAPSAPGGPRVTRRTPANVIDLSPEDWRTVDSR